VNKMDEAKYGKAQFDEVCSSVRRVLAAPAGQTISRVWCPWFLSRLRLVIM
jgi:translation elongation factor EF-1alpha